ncbi:hypothetical protein NZD85_10745 [Empedobacter stercoris]|uniref:hypothetical protein n=1 Tax=Empedobacter stercoris TaxID=1628248 RepID=UPI001CE1633D|nr:hypothetical protein [Empedobacter stercoris]MCA4781177.1 hypothetical protein [Empedobacter stercoris]UWX66362.1 hypothetical protein NZD85_10745 [Empedobacter stercoris]
MKKILLIVTCFFILIACGDSSNNNEIEIELIQLNDINNWYSDNYSINEKFISKKDGFENRDEKSKKIYINGFRKQFNLNTDWDFINQSLEVKGTNGYNKLIVISTHFENLKNNQFFIYNQVFYYSNNIDDYGYQNNYKYPVPLEMTAKIFDKNGKEVDELEYLTIWDGDFSSYGDICNNITEFDDEK